MHRTWILQANPKLYDVDGAVQASATIYWRIPQHFEQVHAGDRALLWRAGKDAGFVGWGVFRTGPERYQLNGGSDPFRKSLQTDAGGYYAPVSAWPGATIPKAAVKAVLPEHRIITAPMGTVFPLDGDDLAAIGPVLTESGFDLSRETTEPFTALPILTEAPAPTPDTAGPVTATARITPALFLLSSTPERAVDITIEGDALRLTLVERSAMGSLEAAWDAVGVYLLVGGAATEDAVLSVYVGKAQALRARIKGGHDQKSWTRCLLVQRPGLHPFNASDISWLERRLIDVLLEAPQVDLVNKALPPPELVPDYKADILERTVLAVLGVLGVLGAYSA